MTSLGGASEDSDRQQLDADARCADAGKCAVTNSNGVENTRLGHHPRPGGWQKCVVYMSIL